MDTLQASDTSTLEVKDNLNTSWTGGYTQIPNSILKAANLDSDSKVAVALLYSAFTYARDNNQLEPDGSFYFTNARFGTEMAISGDQVARKVIPDLIDKGFIRTIKRFAHGKTRNYYILDIGALNRWDGSKKNLEAEAKKVARAKKACSGRQRKEEAIMSDYGSRVYELVQAPMTITERENRINQIVEHLSQERRYTVSSARAIINKMLHQYSDSQLDPDKKPEWLRWQEEIANSDEPLF